MGKLIQKSPLSGQLYNLTHVKTITLQTPIDTLNHTMMTLYDLAIANAYGDVYNPITNDDLQYATQLVDKITNGGDLSGTN